MAKKNVPANALSAREKAQQMREAQKKADQRTRNIIIGVVSVLVLAIVVAIVLIIVNRPTADSNSAALPEQFQAGEPIVVSSLGTGVSNPDVEDLHLYFDYTCPGCVTLETAVGPELVGGAEAGDYNMLYHPVITSGGPYNAAATAGSLAVAANAPEQWVGFHEALIAYYMNVLNTQDASAVSNSEASTKVVMDIAKEVGIPDEVISTFNTNAGGSYLTVSTNDWVARDVIDRQQTASPELVYKDTKLTLTGQDGPSLFASLKSEIERVNG